MENENTAAVGTEESTTATPGASGTTEKVFTQAEVNKMMAREKAQGRNAALNDLGIDPKDEGIVSKVKAFLDANKPTGADKADPKADPEYQKVLHRLLVAETTAQAMKLGVKAQYADDVVALTLAKKTDDSELKDIIGEFKSKYPMWFGPEEDAAEEKKDEAKKDEPKKDESKETSKGTGSSVKSSGKKTDAGETIGERLAAQKKAQTKKSSYWNND